MHQSNPQISILVLLFLCSASLFASVLMPAHATTSTSPVVTKGQLEILHNNNIVLQAQVQGAQLQKQLDEAGTEPAMNVPRESRHQTNARPVVVEITGAGKKLSAIVQLPNGQQTTLTTGSSLPGTGLTVKSITLAGVTLSDGSSLSF